MPTPDKVDPTPQHPPTSPTPPTLPPQLDPHLKPSIAPSIKSTTMSFANASASWGTTCLKESATPTLKITPLAEGIKYTVISVASVLRVTTSSVDSAMSAHPTQPTSSALFLAIAQKDTSLRQENAVKFTTLPPSLLLPRSPTVE